MRISRPESSDPKFVRERFPGIAATCRKFGIDITTDRIPVRPGAHYMIGGVTVDDSGKSSLEGLWAAGEVCSTGLHGANRLASNSLLEGLVYGAHAGLGAANAAKDLPDDYRAIPYENDALRNPKSRSTSATSAIHCRAVVAQRWHSADCRLAERSAATIDGWCKYVLVRQFSDIEGWELQNMLTIARLMVNAAQNRKESRGVHLRMDFPTPTTQNWYGRVWFRRSQEGVETSGLTAMG